METIVKPTATYTFLNRELHSVDDIPAVLYRNGTAEWFKHGVRHREGDLPAVIRNDGLLEWWLDGQLHRDNEPARIHGKICAWYTRGEMIRLVGACGIAVDAAPRADTARDELLVQAAMEMSKSAAETRVSLPDGSITMTK